MAEPIRRGGRAAISPLRLQLLEGGLAAAAFYLAVHLGSETAVVLVVAGVLLGSLALVTTGPLGVVHAISPVANLVVLGAIGAASMLTPIAAHGARSAGAIVVFEGGGVMIGFALVRMVGRVRAAAVPTPATPPLADRRALVTADRNRSFRAAGRLAGRAGASVASDAPRAVGRFIGERRANARRARSR